MREARDAVHGLLALGSRVRGNEGRPGVLSLVCCFVSAVLLAACATPWPPPAYESPPPTPASDLRAIDWLGPKPTLDDLGTYVENFRKLAFWTEWHGRHPYVKKWRAVSFCVPGKYREPVDDTLRKLRVATGLELRTSGACNVTFVDGGGDGCRVQYRREPDMFFKVNRISVSSVEVGQCLEEELSQLMGLPNDLIDFKWTIWNDATNGDVDFLTWHDAVMLRVLYHEDLYRGMPEAAAMKVVPRLMRKVIGEVQ
jgi:hypothetical protein